MSYDYKITDLKFRINNLVPQEICQKLIKTFEKYPEFHKNEKSYKYQTDEYELDNFSCFNLSTTSINNPNEDILEALKICKTYIYIIISNYVLHIKKDICPIFRDFHISRTDNIRILKYDVGQLIKDHSDIGSNIRASCTLNLNENYEGGDFRFFNGKLKEKFKTGDAMIFPAEPIWIHGTEPITKGARYSVNCFLQ
jgi:hypothetical protein